MEMINLIMGLLKKNFSFITLNGYEFLPLDLFNSDHPEKIYAGLNAVNDIVKRKLTFMIYPMGGADMDVYITNCVTDQSMTVKNYMDYKQGNSPQYLPNYKIDEANIASSVEELSAYIRLIIEGELKGVVFQKEWISIPVYDPRDAY